MVISIETEDRVGEGAGELEITIKTILRILNMDL